MRPSDAELIAAARAPGAEGSAAFAELWSRYRRAGLAAARGTAPELDAEDVVSEAYTRILDLTKRGRGPTGAFRPYLYRVVRSIALSWRRVPEVPDEELDTRPATDDRSPWTDLGMEQAAVARVFATLPTRWQEALWRTEVEGLPPRRAAELLGLTPNGVSALARRARAGLREAWAAAHQDGSVPATDACRTHRDRLPARHSGRLAAAQLAALEEHLADCPACAAAADELRRASGLRAAIARDPAPHPR